MRVLLIEDDPTISHELTLRWQARSWMVLARGSLAQADEALQHFSADLVVLDLMLPDGSGLDWLARLRCEDRITPVLILTAMDRVSERVRGLQMGADDYLVKPFSVEELDARIEGLIRRSRIASGKLLHFGQLTWQGESGQVSVGDQPLLLSPREFEVLGMLIRRAPRMVPKRVLVDALAERNLDVGDSAVEVYVSRLRKRLEGSGTVIRTMRGFGYALELDR